MLDSEELKQAEAASSALRGEMLALAHALEDILPGIWALAEGRVPHLESRESEYLDPEPSPRSEEFLFFLRFDGETPCDRDFYLDFGEVYVAVSGLAALRKRWLT